eukprot:12826118-Prorocentrum_lima.AAC.1
MGQVKTGTVCQTQADCRTWYQAEIVERDAVLVERARRQDMEDRVAYQELRDQLNQERGRNAELE